MEQFDEINTIIVQKVGKIPNLICWRTGDAAEAWERYKELIHTCDQLMRMKRIKISLLIKLRNLHDKLMNKRRRYFILKLNEEVQWFMSKDTMVQSYTY
jgi:hypothetical protein